MIFLITLASFTAFSSELEKGVVKRSQEILAPFKQGLLKTVQSAVQTGGPSSAVEACQLEAPQIEAKSVEGLSRIRLGRATHRARNPKNVPAPWMKEYFENFLSTGVRPKVEVVRIDNEKLGYIEPIFIGMPLCLQCHGTEIQEELGKKIKELYPEDQAVGFKAGDFRGVFWVEYEASEFVTSQKD